MHPYITQNIVAQHNLDLRRRAAAARRAKTARRARRPADKGLR